jgi:hypothetical protein
MRKVGDLLSVFLDEKLLKKAKGYSSLSSSWAKITERNGIAMAASHSRIKELDRNVLLVEADHSGWLQIFQTKQHKLLEDVRRRFPELTINGISFTLSPGPLKDTPVPSVLSGGRDAGIMPRADEKSADDPPSAGAAADTKADTDTAAEKKLRGYDMIGDEEFKEKLKHLERSIAAGRKKTDR